MIATILNALMRRFIIWPTADLAAWWDARPGWTVTVYLWPWGSEPEKITVYGPYRLRWMARLRAWRESMRYLEAVAVVTEGPA